MFGPHPTAADVCSSCGKPVLASGPYDTYRQQCPAGWHVHVWTCRHTVGYECAACERREPKQYPACPQCGDTCEYT
jgi:DNA-directed RNA polymerase subunit RPC12/RpoP